MVLQTLEAPAVTTFRASDDYHPGQTGYYKGYQGDPTGAKGCSFPYCVYYQGTTAIIGEALAIKPSKDNYWSTNARQPGSFCDKPEGTQHCREPYSEMQSAISSYTTAQVALTPAHFGADLPQAESRGLVRRSLALGRC